MTAKILDNMSWARSELFLKARVLVEQFLLQQKEASKLRKNKELLWYIWWYTIRQQRNFNSQKSRNKWLANQSANFLICALANQQVYRPPIKEPKINLTQVGSVENGYVVFVNQAAKEGQPVAQLGGAVVYHFAKKQESLRTFQPCCGKRAHTQWGRRIARLGNRWVIWLSRSLTTIDGHHTNLDLATLMGNWQFGEVTSLQIYS